MSRTPNQSEPWFLSLLDEFNVEELDRLAATIYGLTPDLKLAYTNPAWHRFALENGGSKIAPQWGLGRSILEAIAEPLRPFFVENYRRCLELSRPWEHTYDCSSADLYRRFHMMVYPLGQRQGFLVVNSLCVATAHTRPDMPPLEQRYRNAAGIISQCCHCRRIRRVGDQLVWDWVSAWVRSSPEGTSHGICPECLGFHYSPKASTSSFAQHISTIDQQPAIGGGEELHSSDP